VRNGDDPDSGSLREIHDEVWEPADKDSSVLPAVSRPSFREGNDETDGPFDFFFESVAKPLRAFGIPA